MASPCRTVLGQRRLDEGQVNVLGVLRLAEKAGRLFDGCPQIVLRHAPFRRLADHLVAINVAVSEPAGESLGQHLAAAKRSSRYGDDCHGRLLFVRLPAAAVPAARYNPNNYHLEPINTVTGLTVARAPFWG